MWDVLTNLNNDYKLLFKFTVRPPTVVYFLSRIMTLAFLVSAMLFPSTYTHFIQGKEHVLIFN